MKLLKTIHMACGQAYVIGLDEQGKELLEMGDVFLPNENAYGARPYKFEDFGLVDDRHKRVITICSMVGCCYGCKFCSVRRTFQRMLTISELIGQVDFCVNEGLLYGRSPDPNLSREFNVLYTRMGEPLRNADNVIESMYILADRYSHIKFGLSTCGIRGNVQKLLNHPRIAKHIMMQFSAHGTDEETRSYLFEAKTGLVLMTLKEIADFVKKFRKLNPRKVSLNFILLQGFTYDFASLRKLFNPEDIYLRFSPLNVTENSHNSGIKGLLREDDVCYKTPLSSRELKKIMQNVEDSGFAYAYAPAIDEEIKHKAACGQALETLKKSYYPTFEKYSEKSLNSPIQEIVQKAATLPAGRRA